MIVGDGDVFLEMYRAMVCVMLVDDEILRVCDWCPANRDMVNDRRR